MEAEKAKCAIEDRLMADLRLVHRREAQRIIDKCREDFSRCVFPHGTGTTTTGTTTRTQTSFKAVTTVTTTRGSGCLRQVISAGTESTPDFVDCVTDPGNQGPYPPLPTTTTTTKASHDCSMCNKFCRAFNWSQLDPGYAQVMQYSQSQPCSDTVCPWPTLCSNGDPSPALHPNCSAKGCPCFRASCITTTTTTTTTTTIAAGGRRLRDLRWQAELERMQAEAGDTRHLQGSCMCQPGLVATVLVGRPYRVFYGDVAAQMAKVGLPRLLQSAGRRKLNDPYYDAQLMNGVEVRMEDANALNFEETFDCREYFSNRFHYVYPKTLGPPESLEAFRARNAHADLGCGYSGEFKVTCIANTTAAALGLNGCNYKVDISTCKPPSYAQAVDSCWIKEPDVAVPIGTTTPPPVLTDWLGIEEINETNETVDEWKMPPAPDEKCCTIHVSSECVPTREFPDYGTINGSWQAERSYKRETPYFQSIACSQQAQQKHHACPQVRIKRLPGWHQVDLYPQCFDVCNLTSVQEEFNSTCNSTVEETTRILQETALAAKVQAMKAHKDMLRQWSRSNWPKVVETKHVIDCVADALPRSFNRLGYPKRRNEAFDKLRLDYQCRIHNCKANQCLKVTRPCHIDHMDSPFENTCGPLGDQNQYQCVDKVEIFTTGFSWLVAYGFFGLAFTCLACMFGICIRSFTKRNAKVAPMPTAAPPSIEPPAEEILALPAAAQACKYCGTAFEPGEQYCRSCSLPDRAPPQAARCPMCETVYQPDDSNCMKCGAARATAPPLELIDRESKCLSCGAANDPMNMFCIECGERMQSEPTTVAVPPGQLSSPQQRSLEPLSPTEMDSDPESAQRNPMRGLAALSNSPSNQSRIQPFTENDTVPLRGLE